MSESLPIRYTALPLPVREWERAVKEAFRETCANCGSRERLGVKMIVPVEAGGQLTVSNGVLLCRVCELAAETVTKKSGGDQRLVNFWVSRSLFDRIQYGLENFETFTSMGALVRYLIGKYVEDERKFDDLAFYQDRGTDAKINVWIDREEYAKFKAILDSKGLSVTDAIRSLIRMWQTIEDEKAPHKKISETVEESCNDNEG